MKTHFATIRAIANQENTRSKLRAGTLEKHFYLIDISRHEV